jgi:hypothetical protein
LPAKEDTTMTKRSVITAEPTWRAGSRSGTSTTRGGSARGVSVGILYPGRQRAAKTRVFHRLCFVNFVAPKGQRRTVRVFGY